MDDILIGSTDADIFKEQGFVMFMIRDSVSIMNFLI